MSTNEQDRAKLAAVEKAILDYHAALSSRMHGGVAADKAISEIETALNLHWVGASGR